MSASRLELNSAGWRNVSGLTQQSRVNVGCGAKQLKDEGVRVGHFNVRDKTGSVNGLIFHNPGGKNIPGTRVK
jgi:hypothetical protein